jgi:hypothetical protein
MKVLAIYTYNSPEGTVAEGEDPISEKVAYSGNLRDIFLEIADNYDGKEFFMNLYTEAQSDLKMYGEFHIDDYSSGQYTEFRVIRDNAPFTHIEIN